MLIELKPAKPAPRCRRCGALLNLRPLSPFTPSVDAMNVALGHCICQQCLTRADDDASARDGAGD